MSIVTDKIKKALGLVLSIMRAMNTKLNTSFFNYRKMTETIF
nr:MAG TPA: hypothetical protein [Caudoviricetes sp.]